MPSNSKAMGRDCRYLLLLNPQASDPTTFNSSFFLLPGRLAAEHRLLAESFDKPITCNQDRASEMFTIPCCSQTCISFLSPPFPSVTSYHLS